MIGGNPFEWEEGQIRNRMNSRKSRTNKRSNRKNRNKMKSRNNKRSNRKNRRSNKQSIRKNNRKRLKKTLRRTRRRTKKNKYKQGGANSESGSPSFLYKLERFRRMIQKTLGNPSVLYKGKGTPCNEGMQKGPNGDCYEIVERGLTVKKALGMFNHLLSIYVTAQGHNEVQHEALREMMGIIDSCGCLSTPTVTTKMRAIIPEGQLQFLCESSEPLDDMGDQFRTIKDQLMQHLPQDKEALLKEYLLSFDPEGSKLKYSADAENYLVKFFTEGFNKHWEGSPKEKEVDEQAVLVADVARTKLHRGYPEDDIPGFKGIPEGGALTEIYNKFHGLLQLSYFLPKYTQGNSHMVLLLIYLGLDNETILWLMLYFTLKISLIGTHNIVPCFEEYRKGLDDLSKTDDEGEVRAMYTTVLFGMSLLELATCLLRKNDLNDKIGINFLRQLELLVYIFANDVRGVIKLMVLHLQDIRNKIEERSLTSVIEDVPGEIFTMRSNLFNSPTLFIQLENMGSDDIERIIEKITPDDVEKGGVPITGDFSKYMIDTHNLEFKVERHHYYFFSLP